MYKVELCTLDACRTTAQQLAALEKDKVANALDFCQLKETS